MKKYNLLLPIAGKAQRFLDAGYTMPKPLILANHKHVIDWSLESVDYSDCNLIFIVRLDHIYNFSIDKILKQKFGNDIEIVVLDKITRGALETCVLAEKYIDNDIPLLIYTPDVYFEPQFKPSTIPSDCDGFLLTFLANSPDHSYSQCDINGKVSRVVEKEVISEHANVGLYYFNSGKEFLKYGKEVIDNNMLVKNEFYIAPMYNLMIRDGKYVSCADTEKMHVLGTPSTLEFFSERVTTKFGTKPIALACDHSGYDLKEKTKTILEMKGIEYTDVGTYVDKSCDYFDYVSQAVALIKSNDCDHAISFCRSGQGVNLAANKFDDILSALIFDSYTAEFSVKHNCANHFAIPSKYVDVKTMEEIIDKLITTSFDGGRHFTRLKKFI
jgi:RpiB/LacA/LacB family sugar-phosphate isomerase|tara:strand:- start:6130 stop:7284 length:1155 start_codon:yes stop_codon:yes gene_type:complete